LEIGFFPKYLSELRVIFIKFLSVNAKGAKANLFFGAL